MNWILSHLRSWGVLRPVQSETPIPHPSPVIPPKQRESEPRSNPERMETDMQTSLRGALEIMAHEAIVLNRYKDSKGIWTIGVGVTSAAGASINPTTFRGTITALQAYELFREILPRYEAYVNRALAGRKVKQHEYDALVSLAYNAGNIAKPNTMRLIAQGDIAGAIDIWRADKILWSRRNKEVKLARTGRYPSESVTVYSADERGIVNRRTGKKVPLVEFMGRNGLGSW